MFQLPQQKKQSNLQIESTLFWINSLFLAILKTLFFLEFHISILITILLDIFMGTHCFFRTPLSFIFTLMEFLRFLYDFLLLFYFVVFFFGFTRYAHELANFHIVYVYSFLAFPMRFALNFGHCKHNITTVKHKPHFFFRWPSSSITIFIPFLFLLLLYDDMDCARFTSSIDYLFSAKPSNDSKTYIITLRLAVTQLCDCGRLWLWQAMRDAYKRALSFWFDNIALDSSNLKNLNRTIKQQTTNIQHTSHI